MTGKAGRFSTKIRAEDRTEDGRQSRREQLYSTDGEHRLRLREQQHGSERGDTEPDWSSECDVCGMSPIVPITGMCGPCTWGEAETIGGNW